jgi:diaminopimelate decarboxylase
MDARQGEDPRFRLSSDQARDLVRRFGTPLYVLDERTFRSTIRRYRAAFRSVAEKQELAYAAKANSTLAILAIAAQEGLLIDVASEGELRAALRAGVPPGRCCFHGNNKRTEELSMAIAQGVGQIVVDNFEEIEALGRLAQQGIVPREILLRLAPGVDPVTHEKISTGQEDTKFGFNIADGSAERALTRALELQLPVRGVHCHVGSQLLDPTAQCAGADALARFAVDMHRRYGYRAEILNFGGGLGVRYTDERPMPVEEYCDILVRSVRLALEGSGLDPTLVQEPGRALIACAGVTLYTVGVVKQVPVVGGDKTYVVVDGGLADNPRPALYQARYAVERVGDRSEQEMLVTVSGRHCETDDLFPDIHLPSDVKPGDILQTLCTGAYNASMASNYNRYLRPPTVLVRETGEPVVVQEQESWDDMFRREIVPDDLT